MSIAEFYVSLISISLFVSDIALSLRKRLSVFPVTVICVASVDEFLGVRVRVGATVVSWAGFLVLSFIGASVVLWALVRSPVITVGVVVFVVLEFSLELSVVLLALPFALFVVQVAIIVFLIAGAGILLKSVAVALVMLPV